MKRQPARVWRFEDAPRDLRYLSTNGGDEDWITEIPPYLINDYLPWVDVLDTCRTPDVFDHPTLKGWKVAIGSHS